MPDSTEKFIRAGLANHAQPQLTPDFATRVMKRVQSKPAGTRTRLLLGACWFAVVSAVAWVLLSIPWAERLSAVLSGASDWLIPAGLALVLWHKAILAWLSTCSQRLLPYPNKELEK